MRRAILLAWAAAFGLIVLPGTARAATDLYVDVGKGQDTNTCGAQSSPCKTINWAELVAALGDMQSPTMHVLPGTYNECVYTDDVVLDSSSNYVPIQTALVATDYDTNGRNTTTIIDATGCQAPIDPTIPQTTVWMGDGGTLRGFTIQNGQNSGVYLLGSGTIFGNVIQNNKAMVYQSGGKDQGGTGGGIAVVTNVSQLGIKTRILGNLIKGNQSELYGGGIDIYAIAQDNGVGAKADVDVVVAANQIENNTVAGNATFGGAGGGISVTTSASDGRTSTVTIAGNNILTNTAKKSADGLSLGLGGGIYANASGYSAPSLPGTETLRITDAVPADPYPPPNGTPASKTANSIRSNVSEGYGGGIHVEIVNNVAAVLGAKQAVVVENNTVSANTADTGGGGIYAGLVPTSVVDPVPATSPTDLEVIVRGNTVTGNKTTVDADPAYISGGGGAFIEFNAVSTPAAPGIAVTVERNTFQNNTSKSYGGGALLFASADAQPDGTGTIVPCAATIQFRNNLLAQNGAVSAGANAGDGGGVYAYAQAQGLGAVADPELRFLTVVDNATNGFGGGIELEGLTNASGELKFRLDNSIVVQNEALGVGSLGADCANTTLGYNDVFGNVSGQYEAIFLQPGCTPGDIALDPVLSATTFVPALCSPTVDAGDPTVSAAGEPVPNGGKVNMGHTGGTSARVPTLPDMDGNHLVDGVEVLQIALSFASDANTNPARYNAAADVDVDGKIDGVDLSGVAATFGWSCGMFYHP